MTDFVVDTLPPENWTRYKAIRLRALKEAPDAFGSTLERELGFSDEQWQERLRNPETGTFVATNVDGKDMGLAVGAPYNGSAGLFAMWVAPEARGMGVGKSLVDSVCHWAGSEGYDCVSLDVAIENSAAIALYEAMGFAPNGETGHHPPPREHMKEFQMEKWL